MTLRLAWLLVFSLSLGCVQTQVWQLNYPVPHNKTQPGRQQFDDRMTRLYKMYDVVGEVENWYIVNDDQLVVKMPMCYRRAIEERLPHVACNPDADPDQCKRLK